MKWSHDEIYKEYVESQYIKDQNHLFSDSIHELSEFVESTFINKPDLLTIASDQEISVVTKNNVLDTFILCRVFALRCWVEDEITYLVALLDTYNNPDNNYAIVNRNYSITDGLYRFETDDIAFYNQQDCYSGLMNPWLSSDEIELIRPDVIKLTELMNKVDSDSSYLSSLGRFYREETTVTIDSHAYKIYYSIEYDNNKMSLAEEIDLGYQYIILNGEPIPYYKDTVQTEAVLGAQWYFPERANCMTVFTDYATSVTRYNNMRIYSEDYYDGLEERMYLIEAELTYLNQLRTR